MSHGDRWSDVYAVASPIRDHRGGAVGALTVSGPAPRFDDAAIERMAQVAVQATALASAQLGLPADDAQPDLVAVR